MSTYSVELNLMVSGGLERLEGHLDNILQELEALETVSDAGYIASNDGTVTFHGYVSTSDFKDAAAQFVTDVRTAVHAVGGTTAAWPSFTEIAVEVTDGDALIDA